jgi:hypothetical protein
VSTEPELLAPLRALTRSISDYALALVVTTERDDPDAVEMARIALLPIDNLRARRAKGGSAPEEQAPEVITPPADLPIPQVPEEPTKS